MMGRPWDAAPPAHQQPAGLMSKCGAAYPGGPTHILNTSSKGGLVSSSSSRDKEGCSRTRPLKAKPCQVHDVTTTDTKPDVHHGCIPVGIAVARQRIQPYTPPLISAEDSRCSSNGPINCQVQTQSNCTQQLGCPQPSLSCAQTLGCSPTLTCAPTLGCVQPTTAQLCSQPTTPWAIPPHHPHWSHPPYQGVENCGFPPVGFQLTRDPLTGQLILLPSSLDNRGVLWGGGPSPLQVMAPTQPLLLGDRFVALAHHDRRRPQSEHSPLAGVMLPCDFSKASTTSTTGGREMSQQQLLIQQVPTGSQQVVLSSQLVEQSLGTSLVISNHQLSENTLTLSPHIVPVDTGFQPTTTGLVISHTETNSFLRSDINTVNTVFPVSGSPIIKEEVKPDITDTKNIILSAPPQEMFSEPVEEKSEILKNVSIDASNQTETPNISDEDSTDKPLSICIKEEKTDDESQETIIQDEPDIKTEKEDAMVQTIETKTDCIVQTIDQELINQEKTNKLVEKEIINEASEKEKKEEKSNIIPDLSGLELLSNSIVQFEKRVSDDPPSNELNEEVTKTSQSEKVVVESCGDGDVKKNKAEETEDPMLGGLGLLCELAHLRFIEETQRDIHPEDNKKMNDENSKFLSSIPFKKRPGRPKIKDRVGWSESSRELPPVLEPAYSSNSSSSWSSAPALSPPTLSPHKRKPSPPSLEEEESVGSPTVSSSKKRKVGRPRKRDDTPDQTETIVAKTNLSSKAIVGLLLANQASNSNSTSPQHKIKPKLKAETKVKSWCDEDEELSPGKTDHPMSKELNYSPETPKKKLKIKNIPKTIPPTVPVLIVPKKYKHNDNNLKTVTSEMNSPTKITITTKAAVKETPVTYYKGEISNCFTNKIIIKKDVIINKDLKKEVPLHKDKSKKYSATDDLNLSPNSTSKDVKKEFSKEMVKRLSDSKVKKEEKRESNGKETRKSDSSQISPKQITEDVSVPNASEDLCDPTVTLDHLSSLPMRVLFNVGGFLYAGQLSEVTPPDLYSVTLDKERGHKPHILATEQILTECMLELKCEGIALPVGTRLCAYWSQQYRCLYPGTVYEQASSSDQFVSVEFDDGDNGKINRSDVRLLPKNYPIKEYDPNPLHGIGPRKRNNSSTSSDSHPKTDNSHLECAPILSPQIGETTQPLFILQPKLKEEEKENENINEDKKKKSDIFLKVDNEEERKKLKKKKKMELKKLLANDSVWQDLLKYKRKHRELYKMRHKHKHKHRHKKHKHKRSKSCGERVVTEPKPIKPLIVKMHNLSPPTSMSDAEVKQEQNFHEPSIDEENDEDEEEEMELEEDTKVEEEQEEITVEKTSTSPKPKNKKERQASIESKSKMAVFLPARRLWTWHGKGFKRGKGPSPRARKKIFYKSIKRQDEIISVGDCAVFLSTGRPDRPYIGKIEQMWECWGNTMLVRVSWFYHPEETIPKTTSLPFPGGLFESSHVDENDVQTISHKCDVISFEEFKAKIAVNPDIATNVYDNNDTYYLAGSYDPTHSNLTLLPEVK